MDQGCLGSSDATKRRYSMVLEKSITVSPQRENDDVEWPTKDLEDFKNYIEQNWISRTDNTWTFFGLERVRNTNRAESYHKSLKKAKTDDDRINVFRLHLRRSSKLLHDIRNRSANTQKSGKLTNVKYAAIKDGTVSVEPHDVQIAKMYQSIVNSTLKDIDGLQWCEDDEEDEDALDMELTEMYESTLEENIVSDSEPENADFDHKIFLQDGIEQLFEESDFEKPVNDPLKTQRDNYHHIDFLEKDEKNLSSPSKSAIDIDTTVPGFVPGPLQVQPTTTKSLNNGEKNVKPATSMIKDIHPLYNKYSNPPTFEWCRRACIILGLPFKHFVHRCTKGLNIARCIPKDFVWVKSDGNCGYRAIALLICGDEKYHGSIRDAMASYMMKNTSPEIENFQPGSRDAAIRKRQAVTTELVERLGTGQDFWFDTDDMGILAFMLDVNIICWSDEQKCWCWHNKSRFYNLEMHNFDTEKPTLFMRQMGNP
uniref:Uncharacterized protein n=1 Tax=Panagrolaimus superbus TaxID=310955 RepID=A0A914Y426_9BILA